MEGTTEEGASQAPSEANGLFRKFDDYPWVKDRQFLQGLAAMLGPLVPSTDPDRATAISVQARIWWFQGRLDAHIDPAAYAAHLAATPTAAAARPDRLILARIENIQRRLGMAAAGEDGGASLPSWQLHAPRADLGVKAVDGAAAGRGRGRGDDAGTGTGTGTGPDAPYPEQFRAVIEAVTSGKPVPGVREIPNTVIRQAGITPVGKMQAPRKPWERQALGVRATSTSGGEGAAGTTAAAEPSVEEGGEGPLPRDVLDREFPPVEDDGGEEKEESGTLAAR